MLPSARASAACFQGAVQGELRFTVGLLFVKNRKVEEGAMGVIVTNAKSRIGYGVARSLGREGVKVITADFLRPSMSFFSRYSQTHFIYPSPYDQPEQFVTALIRAVQETECNVLMPTYDETYVVARYQDMLSPYARVPIPTYDQIMAVHCKDNLMRVGATLGICVPQTFIPLDIQDLTYVLDTFQFPVVLKPIKGAGGWGMKQVDSKEELADTYQKQLKELNLDSLMIQEYIPGSVYGTAMLFNHGQLRAQFSHKVLRAFSAGGGTPTVRIGVKFPEMETALQKLLVHLNWHGVCQADFIRHSETGTPYLLDANPRFWGSLFGAVASGVNFPFLLYKMALEGDIEPVLDYHIGIKTRWFWGDARGLLDKISVSKTGRIKAILEFLKLYERNMFYDDFSWRDPLPFFVSPVFQLVGMLKQRTLNPTWGSL
jgi:predicted ATP-grasp superfamily ATP-dependent carboligase